MEESGQQPQQQLPKQPQAEKRDGPVADNTGSGLATSGGVKPKAKKPFKPRQNRKKKEVPAVHEPSTASSQATAATTETMTVGEQQSAPAPRRPPRSSQFSARGGSASSVPHRKPKPNRSQHVHEAASSPAEPTTVASQAPKKEKARPKPKYETKAPKFVYGGTMGEAAVELLGPIQEVPPTPAETPSQSHQVVGVPADETAAPHKAAEKGPQPYPSQRASRQKRQEKAKENAGVKPKAAGRKHLAREKSPGNADSGSPSLTSSSDSTASTTSSSATPSVSSKPQKSKKGRFQKKTKALANGNTESNGSLAATSAVIAATTPIPTPTSTPLVEKKPTREEKRKKKRQERKWYAEYLTEEQVRKGLEDGLLVKGCLRVNPHRRQLAYVTVEGIERDVLIETSKLRNRAFDGDVVALRLFPEEKSDESEDPISKQQRANRQGKRGRSRGQKGELPKLNEKDDPCVDIAVGFHPKQSSLATEVLSAHHVMAKSIPDLAEAISSSSSSEDDDESEDDEEKDDEEKAGVTILSALEDPAALSNKKRRVGEVVAILEENHPTEFVGHLRPANRAAVGGVEPTVRQGDRFVFFIPADKRAPRVIVNIQDQQAKRLVNHFDEWNTNVFLCQLEKWSATSDLPRGRLLKNLGIAGQLDVELEAILRTHAVDQSDFPLSVLNSLPEPENWRVTAQEAAGRRDMRNDRIFTIDPPTARDMDDAISCILVPGSDEIAEVGVHIADVTYFLQPGTPLDEIAKRRATTVYLVESSVPMLPRILCDSLCSLTPHEDRFAVSVIWKVNIKTGEFLPEKPWMGRTVIRSCVKMDYGTAQKMIEGKFDSAQDALNLDPSHPEHTTEKVRQDVIALDRIAKLLRKRRYENGALALSTVKLSFVFDRTQPPTAGKLSIPTSCYTYETKDSNHLIEEFAILANSCVAERIVEAYPDHALIRYHESPRPDLMEEYVLFCDKLGIPIDYSSSGALHRSIQAAADPNDPYKLQVLQLLATKAFKQARYACTGAGGVAQDFHHFALATALYTHFTSPIRRYADVVVHRLLLSALQSAAKPSMEHQEIEKIAKNCNDKKSKSMRAQEDADFLYLCAMLHQRSSKEVAVVIGLNKSSFEVLLPRFGEAQLIYIEDYPNIVQHSLDTANKKLRLGIAEDYLLGDESSSQANSSQSDSASSPVVTSSPEESDTKEGKGKDEKKKRRRNRKKEDKKPEKKVGKWIELKVFSRIEVEARGEFVGSGKKLALKIRALF